jgi:hypothetical protein
MSLRERIERDRQAFVYAMFGLRTLYNAGSESASLTRELDANLADGPVYLFSHLPRTKMNRELLKAAGGRIAANLLITVYERLKRSSRWDDEFADEPMFQFLRCVRNAAAHDNRLSVSADLRPTPTWQGYQLTSDTNGTRVFAEAGGEIDFAESVGLNQGLLEPGDALLLVNNIADYLSDSH